MVLGKSIISRNIGLLFSENNNKTIIIDLNYKNINNIIFNFKKNKEKYIYRIKQNLFYINFYDINLSKLNYFFSQTENDFEKIIIDTDFKNKYFKYFLKKSCRKILILEPNLTEIKKVKNLIKKNSYLENYFIILNKININSIDEKIIEKIFNKKIIGKLKYSNKYNLIINKKTKNIIYKKQYLKIIKNI